MEKTQENIIQNKKSFILYLDSADIFEQLTDKEAGKLIKAVLFYVHTGEKPELPRILNMAFIPIYQALHRDLEKWRKQVEANRENGKAGGRPPKKKTQKNPKNPSGYLNNPINPDSVTDTDTVNDTVFNETLNNFKVMRKQLKKPLTEHGETLLLKELEKLAKTEEEKIAILNQSILNSWQGVFPLKVNITQNKPTTLQELRALVKADKTDHWTKDDWRHYNEMNTLDIRGSR